MKQENYELVEINARYSFMGWVQMDPFTKLAEASRLSTASLR